MPKILLKIKWRLWHNMIYQVWILFLLIWLIPIFLIVDWEADCCDDDNDFSYRYDGPCDDCDGEPDPNPY